MVKCGVFFAVRTEFLNIICTRFGLKGLTDESSLSTLHVKCRPTPSDVATAEARHVDWISEQCSEVDIWYLALSNKPTIKSWADVL
jgi:hypothetical protein